MLSTKEFKQRYPPETLVEELPDSPIASLRDLQYLYGKLYTLSTAGGGDYAAYLTPNAADDLVDTADSLIVVRVDMSGEQPRLAEDSRGPVWLTRYTDNRVSKVAHCKFSAAAGIDHSITHQSGKNSGPEKLARYSTERLTRWATDGAVEEVADSHEESWVIDALRRLGEDDDALEKVREGVKRELDGESATALLTVQVRLDEDGEWLWPADVDAFMAAMARRKLSKLVSKGQATDSSGEATDLVTGEVGRTVGTSEDPQNYYLGKQLETFPGLDVDEAWRTHPLSEDVAVTLMNAGTFVEACTYHTFGAKVYYLPYFFGTPTAERAYLLYDLLHEAATEEEGMTPVEEASERQDEQSGVEADNVWNRLRFYVSAVMPHQMSRYDVFGETLNGQLLYPKQLAVEHWQVLSTSAFDSGGEYTSPLPSNESWQLLDTGTGQLASISTGWYFAQTFAERDDDDADADDPRIEALVDVLSGDAIGVETLLGEYVARILTEEEDDEYEGFPVFRVASQFAQLSALAADEVELLRTDDPAKQPITEQPTYDTNIMHTAEEILTDGGDSLTTKLESFIDETPALAHNPDRPVNDQRRGAFLLGALVGAVGNYQDFRLDRSTTLIDQYPVKSISRNRIKKVTQETVAKTLTYTREKKKSGPSFPGTMFDHIVERLRETVLRPDPEEWEIGTDDLRFYYALGVTYGMNDRYDAATNDDTDEEQ